jgi:hypothetical protein
MGEQEDRLQTFREYLRQYNVLKDIFGCRDAGPILQGAEILGGLHHGKDLTVGESEDKLLTHMAATQVIIQSSVIDQAVWSWWLVDHCPDLADRKIDIYRIDQGEGWGIQVRCWERYRNSRPELEVWAPVGDGQSIVEAVYQAAMADQFGDGEKECPGEDPKNPQ